MCVRGVALCLSLAASSAALGGVEVILRPAPGSHPTGEPFTVGLEHHGPGEQQVRVDHDAADDVQPVQPRKREIETEEVAVLRSEIGQPGDIVVFNPPILRMRRIGVCGVRVRRE